VQALPPLSSLVNSRRGETVSIILTEKKNKVFFKFSDGTHFGALTMATTYPNLKSIIDQPSTFSLDVPREPFKQSLLRATSFVSTVASKRIVELELGAENIAIRANGDDNLSDTVAITCKGTKPTTLVRIGMNIDLLFNVMSSSHSENLTFGFNSENNPLVVTDQEGDDDDKINVKYVVSGVRLGNGAAK
jgi:DNA polymerase III sliding clamp (beta) subunit (PCNA family)